MHNRTPLSIKHANGARQIHLNLKEALNSLNANMITDVYQQLVDVRSLILSECLNDIYVCALKRS